METGTQYKVSTKLVNNQGENPGLMTEASSYLQGLFGINSYISLLHADEERFDSLDNQFQVNFAARYGVSAEKAPAFKNNVAALVKDFKTQFIRKIHPNNGHEIEDPVEYARYESSPAHKLAATMPFFEPEPIDPFYFQRDSVLNEAAAQFLAREQRYNFPESMIEVRDAIISGLLPPDCDECVVFDRNVYSLHDEATNTAELVSNDEAEVDAKLGLGKTKKVSQMRVYQIPGLGANGETVEISLKLRVKEPFSSIVKALDKSAKKDPENKYIDLERDVQDVCGVLVIANLPLSEMQPIMNKVVESLKSRFNGQDGGRRVNSVRERNETNALGRSLAKRDFLRSEVFFDEDIDSEETDNATMLEVVADSREGYFNSIYQTGTFDENDSKSLPTGLAHETYNLVRVRDANPIMIPQDKLDDAALSLHETAKGVVKMLKEDPSRDLRDDGIEAIQKRFSPKKIQVAA